jgi:hypothetical protein
MRLHVNINIRRVYRVRQIENVEGISKLKKIKDLENQIEQGFAKLRSPEFHPPEELNPLTPRGFRLRVTLKGGNDRKKKSTAAADCWSPEHGDSLVIHFEHEPGIDPIRQAQQNAAVDKLMRDYGFSSGDFDPATGMLRVHREDRVAAPASHEAQTAAPADADPVRDLILALNQAELRPDFRFVALKWFRDTALVEGGLAWARSDQERQRVLKEAIVRKMVLTNRIPNPRSPEFPVTSVRLNRMLPGVASILRGSGQDADEFAPASIRGESLSSTVLRDRR